jgi:hypothetical protein
MSGGRLPDRPVERVPTLRDPLDRDPHVDAQIRGTVKDALEGSDIAVVAAAGNEQVSLADLGTAGGIDRIPLAEHASSHA